MRKPASSASPGSVEDGFGLAARRLTTAGVTLLVTLPLVMWLANRSAPLVLALASVCFVAAGIASQGWQAIGRRGVAMLCTPLGLAITGFLLWSLMTLFWSHRPAAQGIAAWGELALPLVCTVAIVASGRFGPGQEQNRLLALAITVAAVMMITELATGLAVRVHFDLGRQVTFIFNRPALTCLMLAVAVLPPLLAANGRRRASDLLLAAVMVAALGVLLDVSESGAAVLGALVIAAVWLGALVLPRLALAMVAFGFAVAMLLAPMMGRLGDEALPPAFHERLAQSHTRDRVDIWLSFGEAVAARLLSGSGFGTSPTLDRHPVAQDVSPDRRRLLAVGHPHSAPLQAWVETGAVGVALIGFAGLTFLFRLRGLRASELAPRLALFAGAFAVASVAHGAWQGWWAAILALAAAWQHATLRNPDLPG